MFSRLNQAKQIYKASIYAGLRDWIRKIFTKFVKKQMSQNGTCHRCHRSCVTGSKPVIEQASGIVTEVGVILYPNFCFFASFFFLFLTV